MAQSGHLDCAEGCPLLGVKRTSKFKSVTSAFDPKRTWQRLTLGCNHRHNSRSKNVIFYSYPM